MTEILMPKATAVWLIDNTGLTFEQIAEFCQLHKDEVRGIADGTVAAGVRGADPIANGQLTREEIEKAEKDASYHMQAKHSNYEEMLDRKHKGPRYTPLSRRQERPNAIAWMVKNHPEVSDAQISKLIGTTKATIQSVRERSHRDAMNIKPEDPVALGLCSQMDLDDVVQKAAEKRRKQLAARGELDEGETLKPIEKAAEPAPEPAPEPEEERKPAHVDADSVFANLGGSRVSRKDEDEDDGGR